MFKTYGIADVFKYGYLDICIFMALISEWDLYILCNKWESILILMSELWQLYTWVCILAKCVAAAQPVIGWPIGTGPGRLARWLVDSYRATVGTGITKSLFILWITGPRSSVRLSLTQAWWLSATGCVAVLEPPPGRGGRQWLGNLPRHSVGAGIPHSHCQVTRSTAILAHSIPSPSSHGSAMSRMGRNSLFPTQKKQKTKTGIALWESEMHSTYRDQKVVGFPTLATAYSLRMCMCLCAHMSVNIWKKTSSVSKRIPCKTITYTLHDKWYTHCTVVRWS